MFTETCVYWETKAQYLNLFEEYTKDPKSTVIVSIKDNKPELVACLGGPQAFDL